MHGAHVALRSGRPCLSGRGLSLTSADAFNHRVKSAAAFLVVNLQLLLHTRAEKNFKKPKNKLCGPLLSTHHLPCLPFQSNTPLSSLERP